MQDSVVDELLHHGHGLSPGFHLAFLEQPVHHLVAGEARLVGPEVVASVLDERRVLCVQELSELLSHGQDGGLVGGADCVSHLPTTGLVADTAKAADAVVRRCAAVPAHALKRLGCCTAPEAAHADIAHGKFRRGGASSVIVVDKGHDFVLRFFCWKYETFFVECSGGVQSCTREICWERRIVHYDRDRELSSAHAQYTYIIFHLQLQ